jgi:hypothetical protein
MRKASIELSDHENKVVNVVIARDGLKGRSAAIARIVEEYEEKVLDPALRPKYVDPSKRKGRGRRANSVYEIFG